MHFLHVDLVHRLKRCKEKNAPFLYIPVTSCVEIITLALKFLFEFIIYPRLYYKHNMDEVPKNYKC